MDVFDGSRFVDLDGNSDDAREDVGLALFRSLTERRS